MSNSNMNEIYKSTSRETELMVNIYFNGALMCCLIEIKQSSESRKMFWIGKTASTKPDRSKLDQNNLE